MAPNPFIAHIIARAQSQENSKKYDLKNAVRQLIKLS